MDIPIHPIWILRLKWMNFTFGCFQNRGTPQIINFHRVFHYKPSILGYPYFWKHPLKKKVTPTTSILFSYSKIYHINIFNESRCFASKKDLHVFLWTKIIGWFLFSQQNPQQNPKGSPQKIPIFGQTNPPKNPHKLPKESPKTPQRLPQKIRKKPEEEKSPTFELRWVTEVFSAMHRLVQVRLDRFFPQRPWKHRKNQRKKGGDIIWLYIFDTYIEDWYEHDIGQLCLKYMYLGLFIYTTYSW